MAILIISDAATDTVGQYVDVIKKLEDSGHLNPPGRLSHVAAVRAPVTSFVDVWESPEAFYSFEPLLVRLSTLRVGRSRRSKSRPSTTGSTGSDHPEGG